MARIGKNINKLPVKPRIHWLTIVNTVLILSLYTLVLLERFGWIGLKN